MAASFDYARRRLWVPKRICIPCAVLRSGCLRCWDSYKIRVPYEALDMAGNAWEWTSSALTDYPYNPKDGREGPSANVRVLRGGSFGSSANSGVRCAYRHSNLPADKNLSSGFRVVVSPGL